jgi:P27 family predicted phage terminase small subunit
MGNPGKRTLNKSEPKPGGLPRCPAHLSKEAKQEWRRVVKILGPLKLATAADRAALAIYCAAWARWIAADAIASLREVISTKSGNAIQNPFRSVANRAEEIMLKAAAEFGMTPSSRSRLTVATPEQGKSLRDLLTGDGPEDSPDDVPDVRECSVSGKPN